MTVKVSSSMVHGEVQWRIPPVAATDSSVRSSPMEWTITRALFGANLRCHRTWSPSPLREASRPLRAPTSNLTDDEGDGTLHRDEGTVYLMAAA